MLLRIWRDSEYWIDPNDSFSPVAVETVSSRS